MLSFTRKRLIIVFVFLTCAVFAAVKFGPGTHAQKVTAPDAVGPIITANETAAVTTDVGGNGGVSDSGRVMMPDGRGIRNAIVVITDAQGVARTAMTGALGTYQLNDVQTGQNYIITVRSKRYHFIQQVVTVTDQLTDVNFVAEN